VTGYAKARYGTILWPHSSVTVHRGVVWRYYLMHAGQKQFKGIGVHAHELGHVLGLPDEYGIGPSSGAGIYCAMADGAHGAADNWTSPDAPPKEPLPVARGVLEQRLNEQLDATSVALKKRLKKSLDALMEILDPKPKKPGKKGPSAPEPEERLEREGPLSPARPVHFCAPCKIALGWEQPRALDPTKKARLYLENVEENPGNVVVLPIDAAGRERLVIEYRGRKGFNASMPRSGLLAWRTGNPFAPLAALAPGANAHLLTAHGVVSVDAAHRGKDAIMFPWKDRNELQVGRVRLSKIEEADGRLYFEVGGAWK
jgi:hypothetical protein